MLKARVYRSAARTFDCKLLESGEMICAVAFGNLLKNKDSVVVGDYVLVEEQEGEYAIREVCPRESEIYRLLVREQRRKVTASNCDDLIIVTSASKPDFKRGVIDRFIVRAFQWNIRPCVLFNKMDAYDSEQFDISFEVDRLKFLGVDCYEISAKFPEYEKRFLERGIEELKQHLQGRTAILVGQSGVGKSRTVGRLTDGKVDLRTRMVNRSGKGSHTTTWSEVIECPPEAPDFYIIDSPGIRSFSLEDILENELIEYFPDVEEVAIRCQFKNCEHREDSPGCAFYSEQRGRDHELMLSRLDSYRRILEEISAKPDWKKSRS